MSLPSSSGSATAPTTRTGIRPGPFAVFAVLIYVASFFSQMLLSAPVTSRLSPLPFVLVQGVLIGLWIVLHRRRLSDAGRPSGTVIGIATVYALEIVLLVMLIAFLASLSGAGHEGASGDNPLLSLFVIFYLLALFSGGDAAGALQLWLFGFAAIMLLPVAIALGFSIWAGTRPSQAPATP